ncbi:hypothetical protein SAMN02745129_2637 [Ferrimonas marina]|uniref:Uncharacterized protein n=1 Tax=Ferrimonas marina TaxID=299255 RepID=A0A1M5UMB7_9GAMM|nr:hypothetical protein SAMN02745129_2637 [Ferrimonas marina]
MIPHLKIYLRGMAELNRQFAAKQLEPLHPDDPVLCLDLSARLISARNTVKKFNVAPSTDDLVGEIRAFLQRYGKIRAH